MTSSAREPAFVSVVELASSRAPSPDARRVLIGGHEYFAKRLARSLSDYDTVNRYEYLEPVTGLADKIRRVLDLAHSDAVYFVGGTVLSNKLIDLTLFLKKPIVMHWVGTDVTHAVEHCRRHVANKRYIERATHFCEVSWIQAELRRIGIEAKIVRIAALDCQADDLLTLPAAFTILSYVREGREEFYGIDKLIQLALDFPDIEIRVVGISRYERPLPGNVRLLGWTEKMLEQYRDCVLFLRLPEHDGLAFSVLEALAHGRYVGYSYDFDGTFFIDSYPRLREVVRDLYSDFSRCVLSVNYAGVEFVRSHFNRNEVLGALVKRLGEAKRF